MRGGSTPIAHTLNGWCRICGRPARGTGGTLCFAHQKRVQRGGNLSAPLVENLTLTERVLRAGNDWLEAEDDTDYEAAKRRFLSLSKELACSTCPVARRRMPKRAMRRVPTPPDMPLFVWARVTMTAEE